MIIDKVRDVVPKESKFTSTDIAILMDFPIEYGFQDQSKKAVRYLRQLCKEGLLYQQFISNGSKADTTDCCPSHTIY